MKTSPEAIIYAGFAGMALAGLVMTGASVAEASVGNSLNNNRSVRSYEEVAQGVFALDNFRKLVVFRENFPGTSYDKDWEEFLNRYNLVRRTPEGDFTGLLIGDLAQNVSSYDARRFQGLLAEVSKGPINDESILQRETQTVAAIQADIERAKSSLESQIPGDEIDKYNAAKLAKNLSLAGFMGGLGLASIGFYRRLFQKKNPRPTVIKYSL